MNKRILIAATLMLLFAGTAQATTLNSLSASPTPANLTSGPVNVTLHSEYSHADGVPGSCGIQLDFGDGSTPLQLLIQVSVASLDSVHAYSTVGSFTASIKGVSMLNPAGQMRPACTGSVSTPIVVQKAGATIVSGNASPNPAKPGQNVTHAFNISHDPSIPGACGARLTYSDGTPPEDILIKAADNSIVRSHAYAAKGTYSATLTGVPLAPRPACFGTATAKTTVSDSKTITLPASNQTPSEVGNTPSMSAIETIHSATLSYPPHPYSKYGKFDYSLTSSGANPLGCGYEALLRHTPSGATWRDSVILPKNTHQHDGTFYNMKPGEDTVTDKTPPFPFGSYLLTITPKNGLKGNNGETLPACAVDGGKQQASLYLSAQQSGEPAAAINDVFIKPPMVHAGTETPVMFNVYVSPMSSTSPPPPGTRCNASVIIRDKSTGNVLTSQRTSFPYDGVQDINLTHMMKPHGGFKAGTYEVEASASAENLHNADGAQNNNFNCHDKKQKTLSVTSQGSVIEGVTWSSFQVVDDHSGKNGYRNNTYRNYEIRFMPRISGSAPCSYLIENLEGAFEVSSADANGPYLSGNFDPITKKVSGVLMGYLFTEHPSQLFRIKIAGHKGDYSPCKVDNGIFVVRVTPNSAGTNNAATSTP